MSMQGGKQEVFTQPESILPVWKCNVHTAPMLDALSPRLVRAKFGQVQQ